jgi:hypothetical protein
MKKLMLAIGIFTSISMSANAQDRRNGYDNSYPRYEKEYGNENRALHPDDAIALHRRSDNDGSYDRNWRKTYGTRGINSFQKQARERIANGVAMGKLTSREVNKLMRFYEKIEIKENRYLRNGRISNHEAHELQNDLNELNMLISREMRNREQYRSRRH